ncbi:MAG: hypothetical protein M1812_000648 [Candelaria pacifica]|nr:MAG: hypothetical protein M1812_000648 [Candelaria pacifica]
MATALPSRRHLGPRFGSKQIFLPNFTLTLLRTPFLPPTFASFIVPLNLTKIDVRDYIFHAYGVEVLTVRSFVHQQKVRQDKPNASRPQARKWFRPRAIKKMTIEMERPFVWPDEPDNYEPWDKVKFDQVEEAAQAERDRLGPQAAEKPSGHRESIAEQARRLSTGKARWSHQWEDVGEPVEVEKDLPMS